MENKGRLNHIESIRAFAALSVALFHFTNYHNGQRFLFESETVRSVFVYGAQGVELFYAISGFIIPYSLYRGRYQIKHYFHYLGKRLSRLFPPYFATILLITLVSFVLTTYLWGGHYDFQWRKIIANAFFAVDFIAAFDGLSAYFPDGGWINPIFKTLKVEFQFYLLIGLLFPLINKNRWVLLVFTALMLALGVYTQNANTVLVNAPFFLIGIAAFYVYEEGWNWQNSVVLIASFVTLFQFYVMQDFIVGVLAFLLINFLPTGFGFLKFTGKISYSYYLIHGLTGGWFLYFTSDTYLWKEIPALMVIFALMISWLGAFLMYFCIEKPSLIISKKIKYKP